MNFWKLLTVPHFEVHLVKNMDEKDRVVMCGRTLLSLCSRNRINIMKSNLENVHSETLEGKS